jgi:NAD-dependent oxidoreductase involved in siderophore biosynthesis
MVDKKKIGNLLIGMRPALRQPLTNALPTASGTMLLDGLLSKAPMRSRFIACLHSHGAPLYHSPLRIRASFFLSCRGFRRLNCF